MEKHRLALIGCGGMSGTHVARLGSVGDRLEVAAAVDVVEDRAKAVAEHFPGTRTATDYREVLNDVDVVLLVLPHHLHHPISLECLKAGKHALVEKPMANTERQCLEMIEAARKADRVLMVAYCMRYTPILQEMKKRLEERAHGDVFQVSLWTEQLTRYPPHHWASRAEILGGGQLFSHGCHYIDLLLWFLGRPLCGNHVGTNRGTPWMEREGTSHVTMQFDGGALGYHFGTWGARGSRLGYSFQAHCTEGMLEGAWQQGKLILHRKGREEVLLETETHKHTQEEMKHFLDCIDGGRRPLTDGPRSLQSLRVIWRLYEAEERGVVADLRGLGLDEVKEDGSLTLEPG